MPQSPVYVPLLPEQAQWAIGQLHPVGELPFSILLDEGFDTETYIDIFDGGPTVDARVAMLKTVAGSRRQALQIVSETSAEAGPWHLVANTQRQGFRALLRRSHQPRSLVLDSTSASLLQATPGAALRTAVLQETAA